MLENVRQNLEKVLNSDVESRDLRNLSLSADTFYAVSSAVEVGIFQGLQKPRSSAELADVLRVNPLITDKLCKALVSIDYLEKMDGLYSLSDLAKTFLVESSPFYQGHLLKLMRRTRASRWDSLSKALKEGPLDAQPSHQIFDELFSLAMAEGAIGGSLQKTLKVLQKNPEFLNAKKCLDLGGSHGLYSLAFTRYNPELHAFVFDLPKVIDGVTKRALSGSGRISTLSGDFCRDDLGQDYDFVFASDVLYRQEDVLRSLLDKIRSSLNQDGLFVSKHYHIDDLHNDSAAVLFDLMFSISGTGSKVYSTADFCSLLESTGFSIVQMEDISSTVSRSKIIMARKEK